MRAGARGYVLKDADKEEVVYAIRAVGRSEAIFSPAVATRVLAYFAASPSGWAPPQAFPKLTDRERETLILIAQGNPNPSIARQLSLSTKTAGNDVSNIFTKLQVADRAQAIIRAREAGLGLDRTELTVSRFLISPRTSYPLLLPPRKVYTSQK